MTKLSESQSESKIELDEKHVVSDDREELKEQLNLSDKDKESDDDKELETKVKDQNEYGVREDNEQHDYYENISGHEEQLLKNLKVEYEVSDGKKVLWKEQSLSDQYYEDEEEQLHKRMDTQNYDTSDYEEKEQIEMCEVIEDKEELHHQKTKMYQNEMYDVNEVEDLVINNLEDVNKSDYEETQSEMKYLKHLMVRKSSHRKHKRTQKPRMLPLLKNIYLID